MKKAFGIPKAFAFTMVETRGIEPLTSRLPVKRSPS